MQWLAEVCVRRPVFATVLMLFITVVGWASYFKLSVDRFPKIDFPIVTVVTRLDGAAPEEVETDVTDKIEEAVNTISGIDELRSISVEGVSQVFVSFVLEKDINVAAQEVRDKVNSIMSTLPKGTEAPIVDKFETSPIALKAADRLTRLADVEAVETSNSNAAYQVQRSQDEARKSNYQQCMNEYSACQSRCDSLGSSSSRSSCRSGCVLCNR